MRVVATTTTATMTTIIITEENIHHSGTGAQSPSVPLRLCGGFSGLTTTALLKLQTWLSPAFPTGAFAYSHGLEWAVDTNDIRNESTLLTWLSDVIGNGTGRTDAILLRHAHRGTEGIAELAAATAASRERLDESLNQGAAFLLAAMPWGTPATPERIPYPVAVGFVARHHDVPEDATAAAYLQAFATNLISAAVRLVPLGQTAGLRVLAALEPLILATAADSKTATPDDLGGCAFRSDIAAMRHETQYTRLFRS